MALLKITCPECKAGLKSAKGFTPGQTVSCPKCETYFKVEDEEPADFEEVEEEDEKPKAKKPLKAAAAVEDDDEPKLKKNKKKKSYDEDDDNEERSYKNSPIRFVVLGILIVIMLVLAYFLYEKRQRETADNTDNRENNGLIPNTDPIPPPPGKINNPGAPKLPGGNNPRPKLPGIPGIPPPPPNPNPKPKGPNTGVGIGGAGMLGDLLSSGGPRTPAQAEALTKKFTTAIVGTWNADLGKGVTQELVYKNDGTFTAKLTGGTNATATGKYAITGLSGTKGLKIELTIDDATRKVTATFEDDELQHPSLEPGVTATFRKK